jgi:hypothetical protein
MPNITADAVLNKDMYAKTNIDLYDMALNKKGTLQAGALIGNVYSYLVDNVGNLYWMFYMTPEDYTSQTPTYVKHDASELYLPSYADLMQSVTDKIESDKLASMGTVNYYIQKYAPYLIAGVVAALVLPPLLKNKNKNISGMTKDNSDNAMIFGGVIALAWFLTLKKRTGTVIVDPLDAGSYGPTLDASGNPIPLQQSSSNTMPSINMAIDTTQPIDNTLAANQISYVGPFAVSYGNQPAMLTGKAKPIKSYVI